MNAEHKQTQALEAQRIKNSLNDIRGRMYRQALLQTVTTTFFYALVLLAMLFLLNRVIPLPMPMVHISWIVTAAAVISGICLSVGHRKDLLAVARAVDEKMELRERLSTAFGLIQTDCQGEFAQLQIGDAAATVTTLNIAEISPYRLPKIRKLFPIPLVLILLSFAIPPFYEMPAPLTRPQQRALDKVIQNLEGRQVKNPTLQAQIRNTLKRLKAAKDLDTAQNHLSEIKKEVRKQHAKHIAITEATAASQTFRDMDANQLTAELKNLAEQPAVPPELQTELMDIFQRLAENLPKGRLVDSLNQVQGQSVTPETLQDIIAALENIEKSTDLTQLAAQLTADQKTLALATIEVQSPGGGIANSDGAPGQDAGTSEVTGTREGVLSPDPQSESQETHVGERVNETDSGDSTPPLTGDEVPVLRINGEQLILTAETSGNAQSFSDAITGEVSNKNPTYLPFSDVVRNAERAYTEALENNRIPRRYRAQVKAYLEAISTEENEKKHR